MQNMDGVDCVAQLYHKKNVLHAHAPRRNTAALHHLKIQTKVKWWTARPCCLNHETLADELHIFDEEEFTDAHTTRWRGVEEYSRRAHTHSTARWSRGALHHHGRAA